jgi:hypothetical protein
MLIRLPSVKFCPSSIVMRYSLAALLSRRLFREKRLRGFEHQLVCAERMVSAGIHQRLINARFYDSFVMMILKVKSEVLKYGL